MMRHAHLQSYPQTTRALWPSALPKITLNISNQRYHSLKQNPLRARGSRKSPYRCIPVGGQSATPRICLPPLLFSVHHAQPSPALPAGWQRKAVVQPPPDPLLRRPPSPSASFRVEGEEGLGKPPLVSQPEAWHAHAQPNQRAQSPPSSCAHHAALCPPHGEVTGYIRAAHLLGSYVCLRGRRVWLWWGKRTRPAVSLLPITLPPKAAPFPPSDRGAREGDPRTPATNNQGESKLEARAAWCVSVCLASVGGGVGASAPVALPAADLRVIHPSLTPTPDSVDISLTWLPPLRWDPPPSSYFPLYTRQRRRSVDTYLLWLAGLHYCPPPAGLSARKE